MVMDVIALVKEAFQSAAEHAASYKMGQFVLRHVDKVLWVIEKSARWAVPPPLDPEERPQPELVRPLPWVFFLMMLVTLRVARESLSLVNLALGKPPVRSADVVTYIQGKRRYLRMLKYQGNRAMRARTGSAQEPWHRGLRSLFEFTMCFRRQPVHYGNNNTTSVSNNDEVLVMKRSKRVRQPAAPAAGEASMERLIEKMMVDLDADSNDDSSYTLTNATSVKSDGSEDTAASDQEANQNAASEPSAPPSPKPDANETTAPPAPAPDANDVSPKPEPTTPPNPKADTPNPDTDQPPTKEPVTSTPEKATPKTNEDAALRTPGAKKSPLLDSMAFIQNEKQPAYQRSPKREQKMGKRMLAFFLPKQKPLEKFKDTEDSDGGERRDPESLVRASSADFSARGRKDNVRQTP